MTVRCQACVDIPLRDAEQRKWWNAARRAVRYLEHRAEDKDDEARGWFENRPYLLEEYDETVLCETYVTDPSEQFPYGNVVLHGEDYFVPDAVGHLIQHFLKECNIKEPVAFAWSDRSGDCDEYGSDCYGGGVVVVTAEEIIMQSTRGLIEDWLTNSQIPYTLNLCGEVPYGGGSSEPDDG